MFAHISRVLAVATALAVTASGAGAMGGRPKADVENTDVRIAPVGRVELATPAAKAAPAGGRSGEQIYRTFCGACHETGVAGSPKTGDKTAWAPRLALGLDGLVKSAKAGKNAMPPKGGSDADDRELAAAVVFMTNKSGANFPPPAAK